jgi:BirA family transcriptional regulator, biotin operon repressor / biotin---[acetyl-CoA-carboxylase] ligase
MSPHKIMALKESTGLQWDWQAQRLRAQLAPALPGLDVEIAATVESTNSTLVDRMRLDGPQALGRRSADSQPCLLVAEHQTRGRGRLGRAWTSAPGASLTFSLALPMAPVDWSGLSLAAGVAIADALEPCDSTPLPRLMLKWPNDLWLVDPSAPMGGRKLGGILIETVPAQGRRMCVVGVGLNVSTHMPIGRYASGYASLAELAPGITPPDALHRLALPLVQALQQFEACGFPAFAQRFASRDLLAGKWVTTTLHETPQGHAEGVDARGALRLLCSDGRRMVVSSGEVSIRPGPSLGQEPAL